MENYGRRPTLLHRYTKKWHPYTLPRRGGVPVRTNIELDDALVRQAMRSSGARTKKAAVEAGLRLLVKTHAQTAVRKLRGKVKWEGDLEESRQGRHHESSPA
jgi:Arc/MetJ family transcription regulator